jgi:Fe2+ or Zn2+ uptake regulation protein
MSTEIHDVAAGRLRAQGQRYTTGRRKLVTALVDAGQPMAIPDLLEKDRAVAQSSAYRNLAVLEEAGVVCRIVTSDEFARWELTEDLTEHHHHLICTRCGSVADVTLPSTIERTLDKAISTVESDTGFRTDEHRLDLLGTCASCV